MRTLSDDELLGWVSAGQRPADQAAALDELFARHYLAIRDQATRFFAQRLGGRKLRALATPGSGEHEPVEVAGLADRVVDLVRERIARVTQLRDGQRLRAWLYRVTLNACRDQWRCRAASPGAPAMVVAHDALTAAPGAWDAEGHARIALRDPLDAAAQQPLDAAAQRLDVATRATAKLAYLPPHDLDLALDELRWLCEQRRQPPDRLLDSLYARLGPAHDALLSARSDHQQRQDERLGTALMTRLRTQQRLAALAGVDPTRRPAEEQRLRARLDELSDQFQRLLDERRKSRPRLWRLPAEVLGRFLCCTFDALPQTEQKRLVDTLNQRLTRFRHAFRLAPPAAATSVLPPVALEEHDHDG